jgi:glycosyltransferase involved in cell wall biosynthesis
VDSESIRLVTIGLPCFNEEKHVAEAVESAVTQCHELIIADNASTDETSSICREAARNFPNVRYHRHATNQGAVSNFRFLLEAARTPFFMWLGAHDRLPAGYVAELAGALEQHPDAVLAFSPALHIDASGRPCAEYRYDFAPALASNDAERRVLALIRWLSDCSLIHGVHRTDTLRRALTSDSYLGVDHVLLTRLATIGTFAYDERVLYHRRDVWRGRADHAAQLRRLSPTAEIPHAGLRVPMMRAQYAILADLTKARPIRGVFVKLYASWHLSARFGPFSRSFLPSLFQKAARFLRKASDSLRSANRRPAL